MCIFLHSNNRCIVTGKGCCYFTFCISLFLSCLFFSFFCCFLFGFSFCFFLSFGSFFCFCFCIFFSSLSCLFLSCFSCFVCDLSFFLFCCCVFFGSCIIYSILRFFLSSCCFLYSLIFLGYDINFFITKLIFVALYVDTFSCLNFLFPINGADDPGCTADCFISIIYIQEDYFFITCSHVHIIGIFWQTDKYSKFRIHITAVDLRINLINLSFTIEKCFELIYSSVCKFKAVWLDYIVTFHSLIDRIYQIRPIYLKVYFISLCCITYIQICANAGKDHS